MPSEMKRKTAVETTTKRLRTACPSSTLTSKTKLEITDKSDTSENPSVSIVEDAIPQKEAWNALFSKSDSKTALSVVRPLKKTQQPISSDMKAYCEQIRPSFGLDAETLPAESLKIIAWNVNGLRALLKYDESRYFHAYVREEDADIICLSETKIDSPQVEKMEDLLPKYPFQYWSCAHKKGYAGTAVCSKLEPLQVRSHLDDSTLGSTEGRFLALEFEKFWLVHTYVPNAGMKLERLGDRTTQWDAVLLQTLQSLEKESEKGVIWCGDLNVAHQDIDIHDPKNNRNKSPGFTDAERNNFGETLKTGFVDTFRHFHPEKQQFTYWSYRFNARTRNKGWRLDYFVVSERLMAQVKASFVREGVKGSDHVPVGAILSL
uniref:DNA-(apurinic or apyrimidinic site) endonuclease n=1 Tax=Albugo laibachii Nc14 TaxID=890382 RepID=F0W666_9STRA|nr:exodeoxyribonuclease putative [Albugo laibachii Nc14]|eukprot:CCA16608.1 exodeoxyribonuclease putative [Albugo laibachii Nc14]